MSAPKAYSYIRFSTPQQSLGDSFRRQLEQSRKYAAEHKLDLDESLTFRDLGVSAFTQSNLTKGGQLRAFLDAIDRGAVLPGSYLLVESLDRITRAQILEALEVFTGILNRGITVVTFADGMTYSKDKANKQFTDLIISIAIMSRAHEESLTKSKRLQAVWSAKRDAAGTKKLTRICPAWLKLNEDGTVYMPIPKKVAIVREIVRLILSGMGRNAIAKRLNGKGIESIGSRGKSRTWFPSYIVKIIRSRALMGEFQPHKLVKGQRVAIGEPLANYFPSVLTEEEFALLQETVSERGRTSGGQRGKTFSNLFTGLAKCGYCGATMVFVNKGQDKRGKRNNVASRFLVCDLARRGAGCHYVPWVYAEFEDAFFKYVRGADFARFVDLEKGDKSSAKALADDLRTQRAKLEDLTRRKNLLVDAIETASVQSTTVLGRILDYESQAHRLEETIASTEKSFKLDEERAGAAKATVSTVRTLLDSLRDQSNEDLYLVRARFSEHLKKVLTSVQLFPGGFVHSPKKIKALESMLLESFSKERVKKYSAVAFSTQPRKDERCFMCVTKGNKVQVLRPEHALPDILDTMMNQPALLQDWLSRERSKIQDLGET